jgi:hypothetical protein
VSIAILAHAILAQETIAILAHAILAQDFVWPVSHFHSGSCPFGSIIIALSSAARNKKKGTTPKKNFARRGIPYSA